MPQDIPSPIDLRQVPDALAWEAGAMAKRPWRVEFFDAFADALRATSGPILELGSGPGFLAHHLLARLPAVHMVLLDFSPAMHALARRRLGAHANRVTQVERSFKDEGWHAGLGSFDAVVTHQAVHELRHKRHARRLHEEVLGLLAPGGRYLVCDHFAGEGGMGGGELYMTVDEQRRALEAAGFAHVRQLLCKGGLVLHEAAPAPL
jgi:SAM-dependent methyltransferase